MPAPKILVLGATGMLGHKLFLVLSETGNYEVFGTFRTSEKPSGWFAPELLKRLRGDTDAENFDSITRTLAEIKPEMVINCIGIIKQSSLAKDPLASISINALFPHKLANVCAAMGIRMIHIGTDCVFSGVKGNYIENDPSDAEDLYGKTKFLGEPVYPHCITLRTSIIGHELKGKFGLVEWFLSQENAVKGYTNAIYSGFPTIEFARIIQDYVIPDAGLYGLYHISSNPISKYDMLNMVAGRYNRKIKIEPYGGIHCDRSLNSSAFRKKTGYEPPAWPELVETMYKDFLISGLYNT